MNIFVLQVKSYCGHGIGELFHCAPNIPHYSSSSCNFLICIVLISVVVQSYISLVRNVTQLLDVGNKAVGIMKPGQTFTIEPMINAGKCPSHGTGIF